MDSGAARQSRPRDRGVRNPVTPVARADPARARWGHKHAPERLCEECGHSNVECPTLIMPPSPASAALHRSCYTQDAAAALPSSTTQLLHTRDRSFVYRRDGPFEAGRLSDLIFSGRLCNVTRSALLCVCLPSSKA